MPLKGTGRSVSMRKPTFAMEVNTSVPKPAAPTPRRAGPTSNAIIPASIAWAPRQDSHAPSSAAHTVAKMASYAKTRRRVIIRLSTKGKPNPESVSRPSSPRLGVLHDFRWTLKAVPREEWDRDGCGGREGHLLFLWRFTVLHWHPHSFA